MDPFESTRRLNARLEDFDFKEKVKAYYNPLSYAREVHFEYLAKFGSHPKKALLVGMNPGPWGMAQTGVPFADPYIARDWMNLPQKKIEPPKQELDDRPVKGWDSRRKEPSGQRLHGFFRNLYGTLATFFSVNFVVNYCPLVMFSREGRNLTPEDLLKVDREPLFEACDPYLNDLIQFYQPEVLVGVGRFAQNRLSAVLGSNRNEPVYLPHPSPASPIATRDGGDYWRGLVRELLEETGIYPPKN